MDAIEQALGFSELVIRPAVVLLLATCVALAMRRLSAAARHLAWSAALCAVLAIPVLGPAVPDVTIPLTSGATRLIERTPVVRSLLPERPGRIDAGSDREAAAPGPAPGPASGVASVPWRLLWLAGCIGFASLFGVRIIGLREIERRAEPRTDPELLAGLESAKRRLGVTRPVRLLLGDPAAMPMAWGWLTPRILLPSTALDWPEDRIQAVLLHELAHVRRGDVPLQRVADLARAVFWFNPFAWYAARKMLVEREHACDDMVLRSGVDGPEYAHQLLAMTHSLRSARAAAALQMARRSQMTGRLMAILDEGRSRWSPAGGVAQVLVLAAAIAVTAAGLRPAAAAADGALPPRTVDAPADLGSDAEAVDAALLAGTASGCWHPIGRNTNSNRNEDPGLVTAEWRTERCTGNLRIDGRAVLRSDFSGFARLDLGTRVTITEKEGDVMRTLELIGEPDGRIERHGLFDGEMVHADAVDAWLESNLRPLLRLTGLELPVDRGSP